MTFDRVTVAVGVATVVALVYPVHTVAAVQLRDGVLEVDPAKTRVEFRLGGALHTTHGKFELKHGTIKADSATGNAEGSVVVDAASGESGDILRDIRMRDSVLEAQAYPEITFSPQHIDGHLDDQGNFQAKLEGVLALHGGHHQIVIETEGKLISDDLVATAHFSIPYVEWGLKDPSVLFLTVAKEVDIDIAMTGHITWLAAEGVRRIDERRRPVSGRSSSAIFSK
ncbi:MAG: YceI family protein [Candidatus Binataceae bacterium]